MYVPICKFFHILHLRICMSECLFQCSKGERHGRYLTRSRVFITSSCFRFISLNGAFLEKSLYCAFLLLLLRSPRSPTIAFSSGNLLPLAFLLLSYHTRSPLSASSLSSSPPFLFPLFSPVIHLLPAVFHAGEDSCLNVYVKCYFLFL